jgi:hypothetical protein
MGQELFGIIPFATIVLSFVVSLTVATLLETALGGVTGTLWMDRPSRL